jgi:hypothetical protein
MHPPVTAEEAAQWLRLQVAASWGESAARDSGGAIGRIAAAMAAVSAARLPEWVEPIAPSLLGREQLEAMLRD